MSNSLMALEDTINTHENYHCPCPYCSHERTNIWETKTYLASWESAANAAAVLCDDKRHISEELKEEDTTNNSVLEDAQEAKPKHAGEGDDGFQ